MEQIRYTMRIQNNGEIVTFDAPVKNVVGQVKLLSECGMALVGIDGVNGFRSPVPAVRVKEFKLDALFAHELPERIDGKRF